MRNLWAGFAFLGFLVWLIATAAWPPHLTPAMLIALVTLLLVAYGVLSPLRTLPDWLNKRYVVTDRRALMLLVRPTRLLRAWRIEPDMVIRIERGRRLTFIGFDSELAFDAEAGQYLQPIGFEALRDGDAAIAAIKRTQGAA